MTDEDVLHLVFPTRRCSCRNKAKTVQVVFVGYVARNVKMEVARDFPGFRCVCRALHKEGREVSSMEHN